MNGVPQGNKAMRLHNKWQQSFGASKYILILPEIEGLLREAYTVRVFMLPIMQYPSAN
jgi:hypothetical protein